MIITQYKERLTFFFFSFTYIISEENQQFMLECQNGT